MTQIIINHIQDSAWILGDDTTFKCLHENAGIEEPCCSVGTDDCACGGVDSVYCPDCELSREDVDELLEIHADAVRDEYLDGGYIG